MLNDKIILITGGTGTIGTALIKYLLENFSVKRIRILSRDETKQAFLANHYKEYSEKLRFLIGDIRDKERLDRAMEKVDYVFHLAALKHIIACEYNPFEAIKTNVIGVQNLIEASIVHNIEKLIFASSDKAASPSNTMGVTKLLGEKLITTANYYKGKPKPIFYSVRFGNVLGSRGSLIPVIEEQFKNNLPITLTHNEMTRYIMALEEPIKFMINTLSLAQGGEVFVLKMKAIRIVDLFDVLIENFSQKYNKNPEKVQIKEIGMFAGEKIYEELFSIEESERTYEINSMYIILPQITEISTKIDMSKYPGVKQFDKNKPFNSKDGPLLSKKQIKDFLIKNKVIE